MTEITFDLSAESARLLSQVGSATKRAIDAATKRAGASAARKMRAEASRQVRKKKAIKLSAAKKRIQLIRKGAGAYLIRVDGTPLPIGAFKMRQLLKGVKFQANRGSWSTYRGAFIAQMKSGHRGAFRRGKPEKSPRARYQSDGGKQHKHLPIKELYTSGLSSTFKERAPREQVLIVGRIEFEKTFLRTIRSKL